MFEKSKARLWAIKSAVAGLAVGGAVSAHAALPTGVSTFLSGVTADFAELLPLLYPVMLAITGGFIIMGLVKKGAKKASS